MRINEIVGELQAGLERVWIRHGDNNLQGFEVVKRCLHWLR